MLRSSTALFVGSYYERDRWMDAEQRCLIYVRRSFSSTPHTREDGGDEYHFLLGSPTRLRRVAWLHAQPRDGDSGYSAHRWAHRRGDTVKRGAGAETVSVRSSAAVVQSLT